MLKKIATVLLTSLALCAGSANASFVFTLDEATKTVVRPLSGSTQATFVGTVTFDPGYESGGLIIGIPYTSLLDSLNTPFPSNSFTPTGFLLSFTVSSTDTLGLYDTYLFGGPSFITASECQIGGGGCNNLSLAFAINVVESTVPEPGSMALISLGLAGLFGCRRRKTN